MNRGSDRLMRRIQRKLHLMDPEDASAGLAPNDVAELRARLQRLREKDRRFIHVRLSSYVTRRCAGHPVSGRIGGECVAMEV